MKKKILVTGGAGFIGSNLVRHLFENYPGYQVTVVDHLTYAGNPENFSEKMKKDSRFKFWYGDVRNQALMERLIAHSEIVVHLAAESHVARSIFEEKVFFETDVMGTQAVSSAVRRHQGTIERFVHISTSEVYGTALKAPMDEEHALNPETPYAAAKAGADRLVYSYIRTYGIPAVIIRPFNNYGPYQHLEKVIPRFITSAILKENLTVHGNGAMSRDWLYVQDHVEALDKVIHADLKKISGEVINLGTGRDVSVKKIAEMVVEEMKLPKSLITQTEDRPGQVERHISSQSKAEKLLGWKAKTSFEEGLRKTIAWYRDNPAWWQKLLWMRSIPVFTPEGEIAFYY